MDPVDPDPQHCYEPYFSGVNLDGVGGERLYALGSEERAALGA